MHDVIVVGAGPGGSAAASFLARAGVDVLLLDRSDFPRDKVCGDGLAPQAIYWCDRLGCAEEVLAQTSGVISDCDLYINGRKTLTGGFPDNTVYPEFAVLLDRRRFDDIVRRNAIAHGAKFRSNCTVRGLERDANGATLRVRTPEGEETLRARIVIGADGVSSTVSRAIGNVLKDGVMAISLRTYYSGVRNTGAPLRIYFDEAYFPGYAWMFVDDRGVANLGLGYAPDPNFPMPGSLRGWFDRFLTEDLGAELAGATRCGPISGGSAAFYRVRRICDDRVMLIGDAANQADPLNGGGIHKAMEGAWFAAEAAVRALRSGDFARSGLGLYEQLWRRHCECDWQTAEMFLTIAKNPALKKFCLFGVEQIGLLTNTDPRFREFCAGIFSGVVAQSLCLSPRALYHVLPKDMAAWNVFLAANGGATAPVKLAWEAVRTLVAAGAGAVRDPLPNLDWSLEVATKSLRLATRHVASWNEPALT
jgi:geranylgeranyl reductase family protein